MIRNIFKKYIARLEKRILEKDDVTKMILGKQLCFLQQNISPSKLSDIEFKIFSQWGEDGILEYLTRRIPIKNKFFIEFGVENYNESNTRFLMMNKNWGGMIIDSSKENIDYIKSRDYFWKFDLTPINAFITKENINSIISNQLEKLNISKDIGVLSIDIDGVDYWVLKEIKDVVPAIIICEYNGIFGNNIPVSVPYEESFQRSNYHYSNLYFGANLKAFELLLKERNYFYVGSNLQNSNAFFVKKELAKKYIPKLIVNSSDVFEISKIRESRNQNGLLNFLREYERKIEIEDMNIVNVVTNELISIKDLI